MKFTSFLACLALLPLLSGCGNSEADAPDVVLYTSIDEPVARQIIDRFEEQTGLSVRIVGDTEATKSVGIAERLRGEAERPKADVFWGNEVFYTVGLAGEGLFQPYDSPAAADVPDQFKGDGNLWAGVGLRARVIAQYMPPGAMIQPVDNLADLTGSRLTDKIAMARPTAGTTGGHVAALYVLWGDEKADQFFQQLAGNGMTLLGGNSVVTQQVGNGNFIAGLTDNDDVDAAKAAGGQLMALLPDQGEGEIGTLTIPTTVALVANRPENEAAKQLIDFLLSSETEQALIDAQFAAYSVRPGGERSVRSMNVDYAAVAEKLPDAVRRATAILEKRDGQ